VETFYYPSWKVTVDGADVDVDIHEPNGTMAMDLPSGEHLIGLEYVEPKIYRVAKNISVIATVILAILGIIFGMKLKKEQGEKTRPEPYYFSKPIIVGLVAVFLIVSLFSSRKWVRMIVEPAPHESSEMFVEHGRTYLQSQKYYAAAEMFYHALIVDPHNPEAKFGSAVINPVMADILLPAMICREILRIEPDNPYARAYLAGMWFERKRYEDSLQEIRRALKILPDKVDPKNTYDIYWKNRVYRLHPLPGMKREVYLLSGEKALERAVREDAAGNKPLAVFYYLLAFDKKTGGIPSERTKIKTRTKTKSKP
jgi:tetratricopeptide (TPR) repeat protein